MWDITKYFDIFKSFDENLDCWLCRENQMEISFKYRAKEINVKPGCYCSRNIQRYLFVLSWLLTDDDFKLDDECADDDDDDDDNDDDDDEDDHDDDDHDHDDHDDDDCDDD